MLGPIGRPRPRPLCGCPLPGAGTAPPVADASTPLPPPPPGVSGHAHRKWGDDWTSGATVVRVLSMLMLALSVLIAVWAGYNFNHRANMLTCAGRGVLFFAAAPVGRQRGAAGRGAAPGRWRKAEPCTGTAGPRAGPVPARARARPACPLAPRTRTDCSAGPQPIPADRLKADGPYDSRFLPATLAVCLVSSLMVVFSGAVVRLRSET